MKEIPLTQGKVAIVDDEDFEWLSQWRWYFKGGYACRSDKRLTIRMHRLILATQEGDFCDHVDGDRLNNQKSNLRLCTFAENMFNKGAYRTNTSGFKGVVWEKESQKWAARIALNKKRITIGRFHTKEQAALAYNEAALKYHGAFAHLNTVV